MATHQTVGKTATSIRQENGVTNIRYHDTDVVTFDAKTITLKSGGWRTKTTKSRMNQSANQFGLGFQVYQKDYNWYVTFKGETVDYFDGIVLNR